MAVIVNGLGAWTKLGVEYLDLAGQLSREAAWTHTEALIYSNRRGFDLAFPKHELGKLPHPPEPWVVAELVDQEVWADDGSTYNIGLIYPEWQVPRDVVTARREQTALRQQRKRRHAIGDHSICTDHCPHVTRDDLRDDTGDDPRYPDRYGSDRSGTDLTSKDGRESEVQETHGQQLPRGTTSGARAKCWVCYREESGLLAPLVDGLCDRCLRTNRNNTERKSA